MYAYAFSLCARSGLLRRGKAGGEAIEKPGGICSLHISLRPGAAFRDIDGRCIRRDGDALHPGEPDQQRGGLLLRDGPVRGEMPAPVPATTPFCAPQTAA